MVGGLQNAIATAKKGVIKCNADRLELFLAKNEDS